MRNVLSALAALCACWALLRERTVLTGDLSIPAAYGRCLHRALGAAALLFAGTACAADVKVMISAGFHGAYAQLAPGFERASGHRLVTTRGPPSGEPVAAVVARGEAEIGFQQVSELIHVAGVTFVGALPAELQPGFTFAGALTSRVEQAEAASALLRYLAAPEAAQVIGKMGLAPPAVR